MLKINIAADMLAQIANLRQQVCINLRKSAKSAGNNNTVSI
jgi:hypothetical protein